MVLGRSAIEDVLSTTMCVVEKTLNARPLTPVSSEVNLEVGQKLQESQVCGVGQISHRGRSFNYDVRG